MVLPLRKCKIRAELINNFRIPTESKERNGSLNIAEIFSL